KMSKPAGNVIAPQKIIDQYGAEILRLWVASENYREDIRISHEILRRLTDSYRKIRNTFRFILGNLSDMDPKTDKLPLDELLEIDKYILYRFKQVSKKILEAFDNFEFHVFYHAFSNFCVVDLSAFYLDILKDRLYTYPKNSAGRRSSQTALHELALGMTRLIAPVLSFTAEEVWSYLAKGSADEKSVHLSGFSDLSKIHFSPQQVEKWEQINLLKGEVSKALELRRQEKTIGHSLDALVRIVLPPKIHNILKEGMDDLKFIFIVSEVEVVDKIEGGNMYSSEVVEGLQVEVCPAPGEKCQRCWNYFVEKDDGEEPKAICQRCVDNLESAKA
ncbi:MAG: class I tRNA ligase family protein, partial [Nitrospinae bacterium]|nr:class I tRNA ligase family protein [Nitrospinota bacterium]